jgi:hypothetical protein
MVLPAVCLVVTVCVKQHQVGIPAVSPVAVSTVGFHMKSKVPAPTVDRAVTVGGFSASTSLPVGGPTAPATVYKSVQCQARSLQDAGMVPVYTRCGHKSKRRIPSCKMSPKAAGSLK